MNSGNQTFAHQFCGVDDSLFKIVCVRPLDPTGVSRIYEEYNCPIHVFSYQLSLNKPSRLFPRRIFILGTKCIKINALFK